MTVYFLLCVHLSHINVWQVFTSGVTIGLLIDLKNVVLITICNSFLTIDSLVDFDGILLNIIPRQTCTYKYQSK